MPNFPSFGGFKFTLVETIMYFPDTMEKPTVTVTRSNMVHHVAMSLGIILNAFQICYLMPNLDRINNPNPMLLLCKFAKNNKGSKGNNLKLCMVTLELLVHVHNNKNMMVNFILVSNNNMFKKVTLVSMFAAAGPPILLRIA